MLVALLPFVAQVVAEIVAIAAKANANFEVGLKLERANIIIPPWNTIGLI